MTRVTAFDSLQKAEDKSMIAMTREPLMRPALDDRQNRAARALLGSIFKDAVAAASPARLMPMDYPAAAPGGRVFLFALGKAAPAMAKAVLRGRGDIKGGLVVVPHGTKRPSGLPQTILWIEAGHPLPDDHSYRAGAAALALADRLVAGDLLIACISGGGSALLESPRPGVSRAEIADLQAALLASGAPIPDINRVRTALSAIKGGGLLARAAAARTISYILSDVPGDDPSLVASGPTVPAGAPIDPCAILARHGIAAPGTIRAACRDRSQAPGGKAEIHLIGNARTMLDAVRDGARRMGLHMVDLGDRIEGDAEAVARCHARLARRIARKGRPCLILSGGELGVRIGTSSGSGGRNRHYALALALALGGERDIFALAADSDGIDGTADAAGAIVLPDTLRRARALGLDPFAMLKRRASGTLFAALGDDIVTGPTGTNVNDLRLMLIAPGLRLSRYRSAAGAPFPFSSAGHRS